MRWGEDGWLYTLDGNFTGAVVGVAAQDMAGTAIPADIEGFDYRERAFAP